MADRFTTTVRLTGEDVEALARARADGLETSELIRRGLRVVPICPFVAAYIRRHAEYADLVADDPQTPD